MSQLHIQCLKLQARGGISGLLVSSYGRAALGGGRLRIRHGLKKQSFAKVQDRLLQAIVASMGGNGPLDSSNSDKDSGNLFSFTSRVEESSSANGSFCIIEGPETVQDFVLMEVQEIRDSIKSRRNKIFLLMEEVRRLRIQQHIKTAELRSTDEEEDIPEYPSSIPFFPPITTDTLRLYYAICFSLISGIMLFGGLLAPTLELKLGVGGSSYKDFIESMGLPMQLSQVDPIVASFSGGAVGVISALMVVELNNVKKHEHNCCRYCRGTGYLACARCSGTGYLVVIQQSAGSYSTERYLKPPTTHRCPNCSGAAKVMCPTCLCTGMALASEHNPRIDPFD